MIPTKVQCHCTMFDGEADPDCTECQGLGEVELMDLGPDSFPIDNFPPDEEY